MTPVCDIGAAIDRLGGDVELYQDLVRRFLDDTAGGRARVRTAVERLDAAELHRASHSLKGLAASIGATKVTEALAELEALGKRGESDHFLEAWRRFVSDLEQSTPELAAYLPRDQEWAHRDN